MSNDFSKILAAAAAGLAAGVVIGLLIAPDKGSETRKKLRKKLEDITDELGQTFEEKFGPFRKKEGTEGEGEVSGEQQ